VIRLTHLEFDVEPADRLTDREGFVPPPIFEGF